MNKHKKEVCILMFLFLMVSCSNVSEAATSTTSEPTAFSTVESQSVLDLAYYDGIIVITQYYTFLGHGLYEEAYGLLTQGRHGSLEYYVKMAQSAFKTVEIVTIMPLDEWKRQQGAPFITPDPPDRKRFHVNIRAWGEGNMSGSAMNGALQTLFLTLLQEDGNWKIDSFATGLAH